MLPGENPYSPHDLYHMFTGLDLNYEYAAPTNAICEELFFSMP